MRFQAFTAAALLVLASASTLASASARSTRATASLAPDNSRQNRHVIATAEDQPNDRADCVTAARVRRVIVRDDSLSVYGHNIKIIVKGGQVTLEGPVHSQSELQEIAFDASIVVPVASIVNKLTVA